MKPCALAILVLLSGSMLSVGTLSGHVHAQVAAPATATAPAASVGVDESARPKVTSEAWTIQVERSAKADGTLRFRLWRADMPPVDVAVPVKQGQTDRAIALALRDAFRALLGNDFREDVAAGYVQLRALRGERRFGLELVEPVLGVDIELTRR